MPNTKCNLYFISRTDTNLISNKIQSFAESDKTNLAYDGKQFDSNLRYIGANPNNYVKFNDELWRIIGAFKDINDGSGNLEWRTKIIRNENIGNYSFDSSASGVNNGLGYNDWYQADLMTTLNSGPYWNRTSGTCYNGKNNATIPCDFSNNGLTEDAKLMIGNAVWNVGKASSNNQTIQTYYEQEKALAWTGKIGLMYPSDYGYATGGNSRISCLSYTIDAWYSHSECATSDWLFNNTDQWTITGDSKYSNFMYIVGKSGYIPNTMGMVTAVTNTYSVRPTLYLTTNVMITGGSGTSNDPYTLSV